MTTKRTTKHRKMALMMTVFPVAISSKRLCCFKLKITEAEKNDPFAKHTH